MGHAHNNFIEMLSGTGAIGVSAWMFFCGVIFRLTRRASKLSDPLLAPICSGLLGAWGVFHINGLLQVNFWDAKVMHQMVIALGLMLAALSLGSSERGKP